jgi:hypothetical protein
MFPIDLNGLFPKKTGEKTERDLPTKGRLLHVTITCLGPSAYGIIIIDTKTKEVYLHRQNIPEDIVQYNWKLFSDGGFHKMS